MLTLLFSICTIDVSQEHAASIFIVEVHFNLQNGDSMDAFIFIYFIFLFLPLTILFTSTWCRYLRAESTLSSCFFKSPSEFQTFFKQLKINL
jgi:hypothetical protein